MGPLPLLSKSGSVIVRVLFLFEKWFFQNPKENSSSQNQGFQTRMRTRLGGRTVKIGNMDENRFF